MELRISRFRIHCTSLGLQWSGFPGNILHSGLGIMLKRAAPELFDILYASQEGADTRPRRWWMLPPLEDRAIFAPLDHFSFDIFFADMQPGWLKGVLDALTLLGMAGVGKGRGRFRIERVEWIGMDRLEPVTDERLTPALSLGDMLQAMQGPGRIDHLGLQFITPLRLKAEQGYITRAPGLDVLLLRLLARVSQLSGIGRAYLPGAEEALGAAAGARLLDERLTWEDMTRYSARQGREMPMGGLTGWVIYGGRLEPAYPWLAVGESLVQRHMSLNAGRDSSLKRQASLVVFATMPGPHMDLSHSMEVH